MFSELKESISGSASYATALYLLGLASGCSLKTAWRLRRDEAELRESEVGVKEGSKLVAEDSRMEQWETPFGRYWIPKRNLSRESLFGMLAERSLHIYGDGDNGVRPGDIVIDCGANVGTFVSEALDAGAETVIACEPSPDNLECLRRSFCGNPRVILYPKGLWNTAGVLRLGFGNSPAGDSLLRESAVSIEVPVTTIDTLVSELGLNRVDFIKMDIEGAERNALEGGKATLQRFRPRMAISAYHLADDPAVLRGLISSVSGYRVRCDHGRLESMGLLHSRIAPLVYMCR